jgi:hypothetical protein
MMIHNYGEYSALGPDDRRMLGIAFRAAHKCEEESGWFPRWVVVPRRLWTSECGQFDIQDILRITPSPLADGQVLCLRELPKLPELPKRAELSELFNLELKQIAARFRGIR